jgi:transcriptional regulator with XRE-family HTH domain
MRITNKQVLKDLMAARELTQTELAEMAGLSRQLIGHLLTGARSTCRPDSAEKIARVLFVPLTVLFVPSVTADSGETNKPRQRNSRKQAAA